MEEVDEIKDTVSLLSLAYLLAFTSQFNSLDRLVEEVDEIKDTVSLLSQQLNEAEVARANLIQASVLKAIFFKVY